MFYGLDVHKQFIQVCAVDGEGEVRRQCRIDATRSSIVAFASTVEPEDVLVLEATFHSWARYNRFVEAGAMPRPVQLPGC